MKRPPRKTRAQKIAEAKALKNVKQEHSMDAAVIQKVTIDPNCARLLDEFKQYKYKS